MPGLSLSCRTRGPSILLRIAVVGWWCDAVLRRRCAGGALPPGRLCGVEQLSNGRRIGRSWRPCQARTVAIADGQCARSAVCSQPVHQLGHELLAQWSGLPQPSLFFPRSLRLVCAVWSHAVLHVVHGSVAQAGRWTITPGDGPGSRMSIFRMCTGIKYYSRISGAPMLISS
jgi:hypothetical protein